MAERAPFHRLRVRYVKEGRLAFLGHLEVLNTIDRSVRRSGLPFAVGEGFARRMKIQFSQALPVGSSSEAEYFDLRLVEEIAAHEALGLLASATPRDLRPVACAFVEPRQMALEAWLDHQSWVAEVEGIHDASALLEGIEDLREADELHFMRGDKPRVISLSDTLESVTGECSTMGVRLSLETRASARGALRPQILIGAALTVLGEVDRYVRVHRLAQHHVGVAGLVEPFDAATQIALT